MAGFNGSMDAGNVKRSEIVNDLTTGGTTVPLSAEMGKTLLNQHGSRTGTYYCKMADGTMICTGMFSASFNTWEDWGVLKTATATINHDFAASFVADPRVILCPKSSIWQMLVEVRNDSSKITTLTVARPTANTGSQSWEYIAIGRWK